MGKRRESVGLKGKCRLDMCGGWGGLGAALEAVSRRVRFLSACNGCIGFEGILMS